jgi:hypothetical protein
MISSQREEGAKKKKGKEAKTKGRPRSVCAAHSMATSGTAPFFLHSWQTRGIRTIRQINPVNNKEAAPGGGVRASEGRGGEVRGEGGGVFISKEKGKTPEYTYA